MTDRITFAQLEHVLSDLGFRKNVVPKEYVAYTHGPTKAILAVRIHKPSDFVPDYTLLGVRHDLEVYGIIEPTVFDDLLRASAA